MVKKRVKKHSKKMIMLHTLFVLIICILLILLFSMNSVKDDPISDSVLFLDAELVDIEEELNNGSMAIITSNTTEDDLDSHRLSIRIKNNATFVADCYLILTIENETYKNATVVDIPVLNIGEESTSDVTFDMPSGNSNFSLDKFC